VAALSTETVIDRLSDVIELSNDNESKTIALWAMLKAVCWRTATGHAEPCPPLLSDLLETLTASPYIDVQQRAYEMIRLLDRPQLLPLVLQSTTPGEELEVDETLSFAEEYVQEALRCGARPEVVFSENEADNEEVHDNMISGT